MDEKIETLLYMLQELLNDDQVPRNVRSKVQEVMAILKSNEELSVKKHKAMDKMEEFNDDTNLKVFTRSQIWDVVSQLENL